MEIKKKRSILKTTLITLFSVLCAIILFIAFFPPLLSTRIGTQFLTHVLLRKSDTQITIEDLKLSWFGNQSIEGIQFKTEEAQGKIASILSQNSLWDLLFHRDHLEETIVHQPTVYLKMAPSNKRHSSKSSFFLFGLFENIHVIDGHFAFETKNRLHASFSDIQLHLLLNRGLKEFIIEAQGNTLQNEKKGNFTVQGTVSKKTKNLLATLTKFPITGVDEVFSFAYPSLQGLLTDTLGETLDLSLHVDAKGKKWMGNLELSSQRIQGAFEGSFIDKTLTIQGKEQIWWQPDYACLNHLLKQNNLSYQIKSSTPLEIDLKELSLPFRNHTVDLSLASFIFSTQTSRLQILFPEQNKRFWLKDINSSISSEHLDSSLSFHYQSSLEEGSQNDASTKIHLQIEDLFTDTAKLNPNPRLSEIFIDAKQIPTSLLDAIYKQPLPSLLLGDRFSLFTDTLFEEHQHTMEIDLSSQNIEIDTLVFHIGENITLTTPSNYSIFLSKQLLNTYIQDSSASFAKGTTVKGEIKKWSIPLSKNTKEDVNNLTFALDGSSSPVVFDHLQDIGSMSFVKPYFSIEGNSLMHLHLTLQTQTQFHKPHLLTQIFGNNIQVTFKSDANLQTLDIPFQFNLSGKHATAEIKASLRKGKALILTNPFILNGKCNPKWIQKYIYERFQTPPAYRLQLQPTTLYFDQNFFNKLDLKGRVTFDPIHFTNLPTPFTQTELSFLFNGRKKEMELEFQSHIPKPEHQGSIKGKLEVNNINLSDFDLTKSKIELDLTGKELPLSSAKLITKQGDLLESILGPSGDLSLELVNENAKTEATLDFSSEQASCKGSLGFTEAALFITKPLSIHLKINHKSLEELFHETKQFPYHLEGVTDLEWDIENLILPLPHDGISVTPFDATFDTSFSFDAMTFVHNAKPFQTTLKDFQIELKRKSKNGPLVYDITSKVKTPSSDQGSIQTQGSIEHLVNQKGELDLSQLDLNLESKLKQFPSVFLDTLLRLFGYHKDPFSAFFGPQINAKTSFDIQKMSGPISFEVNTNQTRLDIKGQLLHGTCTLKEPVHAHFLLTKDLGDFLFSDYGLGVIDATNPITLFIEQQGFSFPIVPSAPSHIQAPKIQLDMGKITCSNTGKPFQIGDIFKLNYGNNEPLSLWFAPMDMQVHNGKLFIERTEILFNHRYQIAIWGEINLVKETVNLTLGLTAQSLHAALGITGLPESYVLQVPLKGSFGNVQLDTQGALAKIALLIAGKTRLKESFGVWGDVIGTVGELSDDQSTVPPPKKPFPWGNLTSSIQEPSAFYSPKQSKKALKKILR